MQLIQIDSKDTVAVALTPAAAGAAVTVGDQQLSLQTDIPQGHKVALRAHAPGDPIIKYGWPIGVATQAIQPGEHIHVHNARSSLTAAADLSWDQAPAPSPATPLEGTFEGYARADGRAGTRNELWIIPTVGCVAQTAQTLANVFSKRLAEFPGIDGVHAFSHVFGCSQLGKDLEDTQRILAALATHPNAGGVLVLGLGCENNHLAAFAPFLERARQAGFAGGAPPGAADQLAATRVRTLSTQAAVDEHEEGLRLLEELAQVATKDRRETLPLSRLVVGLKCGGSDGLSGITANPLLGRFTTQLCAAGGSAVLTEVPEMFGAEQALFSRCVDEGVFNRAATMVQDFRDYFSAHGQPVDENPSPGNKDGGITSLQEKSLGCVQKGGQAPIVDVIPYGDRVTRNGLTLLDGPGNDSVSVTGLVAAGACVVLFTTGRGTPLGSPVPTLKIASNSALAAHKPGWIDFDAGAALTVEQSAIDKDFAKKVLETASGAPARNEERGYRDIAIFKRGVTL